MKNQMAKGGKRPGAGRKKGAKNKTEPEIRTLARKFTAAAVDRLVELMGDVDGSIALAACKEVLDRGWGRPPQAVLASVNPPGGSAGFHEMWVALTTGKFDGAAA